MKIDSALARLGRLNVEDIVTIGEGESSQSIILFEYVLSIHHEGLLMLIPSQGS